MAETGLKEPLEHVQIYMDIWKTVNHELKGNLE